MIVILGLDGLEYEYVKDFDCKNLMQENFGKTDISEFFEPRTVVLWSSFLAGKNLEKRILNFGKGLWKFRLQPQETFFKTFKKWKAIDVPGFTYRQIPHQLEKKMLKEFFEGKTTIEAYDKLAFKNYGEVKKEFFDELKKDYEILMVYFSLADTLGHLSFGLKVKMRLIYKELDKIAKNAKKVCEKLLIVSDHGMKAVGRFGDHSNYGFWSSNFEICFKNPRITSFRKVIERIN